MLRDQCLDPVDGDDGLAVDRMGRPETAILIEGGDAIGGRDKPIVAFAGCCSDEVEVCGPGGAVVPGGKPIVLGGDRHRRLQAPGNSSGRGDDSAEQRAAT